MFFTVACDKNSREVALIRSEMSDGVAHYSDEKLEFNGFLSDKDFFQKLRKIERLDAAVIEVASDNDADIAKKVRNVQERAGIMIIADTKVSPMRYMTPAINASSLLLRPYMRKDAERTFDEFCRYLFRSREDNVEECYVLENQDGKTLLPYNQIYYFEAREKKIYIRTLSKEYRRYETMDRLTEILPDSFRRCHRSYVVNMNLIERIKLSENMIYMRDGIEVPLSRSYKQEIKEYLKGNAVLHNV